MNRLKRYFGHMEQAHDVTKGPLNERDIVRTNENPVYDTKGERRERGHH